MNSKFLKYEQCKEIFGGISRKMLNKIADKCNAKVTYGRYQVYDVDAIMAQMRMDARRINEDVLYQNCDLVKQL